MSYLHTAPTQPALQTHAHAALTSTRKQTLNGRRSPQSVLPRTGFWVSQESSGKASAARTSSVAAPVAFWSLEMKTRLCLRSYHLCSSPTLPMERGRVQTSTQPLSAQTQTHALFSFIRSDRADKYLCVSLLTYWQPLCWGNWCITSACARVTLEKQPQASIVAVSQLNQRSPLASKCHSGGKRNSHNFPLRSFSADKNTAVMCLESRTCLQWEWTSPVWKCLSVCSEVRGGWSRMKAGGRPYPPSCPSFLSAVVCR